MNMHITSPTTLIIDTIPHDVFPGAILPKWIKVAEAKGYDIVGRIIDRLHLALRCRRCGATQKARIYTLLSAQPLCQSCLLAEWRKDAAASGLAFLRRDPTHRHYAFYLMPCGHEVRRQFELVKRSAAGLIGVRCNTCKAATEADEALARGWSLRSADPEGNPNYRVYAHTECGHDQRIARANMQSGRFSCGECGEDWPSATSYIYAMSFTLASGREVVKLGFSRNPECRLTYQLQRDREMPCRILRMVPMATGNAALCAEKAMHKRLRTEHPYAAIHPAAWEGQIRVKTEIYDGALTPVILGLLDDLEANANAA